MFKLPKLKYNYSDFEPFFDARTMEIHHTKHHQAYVDNLNVAIDELEQTTPSFAKMSLEELLLDSTFRDLIYGDGEIRNSKRTFEIVSKLRNNGGGHLNHSLFWRILKPASDSENLPSKDFLKILEKYFYSFEDFKATFKNVAMSRFGSGWAWLRVNEKGELIVDSTPNQDYYNFEKNTPILGLDLWEHAYYLNYQNRRADYVDAFWNLVDWGVVEENYRQAVEKSDPIFEEGACNLAGCPVPENREIPLFEVVENSNFEGENSTEKRILYTDGSASPNPGPGGFAIIENSAPIALGREADSTNIRMEGLALKKALEILNGEQAEIWTDSEFWINVLTKWAPAWKKSGWKKKSGEIKNLDIVKPLFELFENSNAELKWLKGHAGHDFNEMADEWANRAREGEEL